MRRWLPCAAGVVALTSALAACGSATITQARVDDAVGPAFAHLYVRQQQLLGHGTVGDAQASASCRRNDTSVASQGAGDDWVCQLLLQVVGPSSAYTYELNVKANGCYTADGPPALVGGRTLTTPGGRAVVNPLFAFDGCFQTY
jgi:hypothetical protein